MTRTTVRVPDEMYERIKAEAEREHRSIHGQMLELLERGLAASKRPPR